MIEGLKALKRPSRVRIECDSAYVVNAHRKGWIDNWRRNGWKTAAKKPVENQDLWQDLLAAEQPHEITWGSSRATPATSSTSAPTCSRARARSRCALRRELGAQ